MKPHILYEDQDIIVCLKPAGIPTQTSRPGLPGYGQHFKKSYLSEQRTQKTTLPCSDPSAGSAGRRAAWYLPKHLPLPRAEPSAPEFGFGKYYQAVLLGCPQTADGILEDYLVKDGRTNTSRICTEETPGAKVARLSYHIAKTTAEFSLAEIHLDTGRHHQIRVQMAHLGCPIAGDRKYDPNQTSFSQLQLFACRLEFAHPKTKKHMEFTHAPVLRVFADETPADHPVG